MSYSGQESLDEMMTTFRNTLPALKKMLHEGGDVPALHPTVEMLSALIMRYDRGEIVERSGGKGG